MQKKVLTKDKFHINYDIYDHGKEFLIFLHGLGSDLRSWDHERRFFHKKGISTIAVDLRGHGLSDRPNLMKDYNLHLLAEDLHQVIKAEHIKHFVLVGHSMGGMIAIAFEDLYPKKADGFVLVDTTYKAPKQIRSIVNHHPLFMKLMNHIAEHETLRKKHFKHIDESHFTSVKETNLKVMYESLTHTTFRSWLYTFENLSNFDGAKVLKHMKVPTLIIEGEQDSVFSILIAKQMKNLAKMAHLDVIPSSDHTIVVTNPAVLEDEILLFLLGLNKITKKEIFKTK